MRVMAVMDRRGVSRTELAAPCTLTRRTGSPIACETVDVGEGGMCVCSRRPLAPDEVLAFELRDISGRVRVLRQQGHERYALRFEQLGERARAELARLIAR
jgi:PilZ domain